MPTVVEVLAPLVGLKCQGCGGDGAFWDTQSCDTPDCVHWKLCPDCNSTGRRFWRLVQECERTGLGGYRDFCRGKDCCFCQGTGYVLKPEAELVAAMLPELWALGWTIEPNNDWSGDDLGDEPWLMIHLRSREARELPCKEWPEALAQALVRLVKVN